MRAIHTIITSLTSLSALIAILLAIYLYAPSSTTSTTQASKMATKPSMFNSNGTLPPFHLHLYFTSVDDGEAPSNNGKGSGSLLTGFLAIAVYKKPLALFSQKPMTGFYRDGYCRTGAEDGGNHAVAGIRSFFSLARSLCRVEFRLGMRAGVG